MGELRKLADLKIEAERAKILDLLPSEIETLKRKNAANGLLHSGNTMLGIATICSNALDSLGKTVLEQYRWAVTQSLFASQAWVDELVGAAPDQLQLLFDCCVEHVSREAAKTGTPNAVPECVSKLETKRSAIANDISLSLRSSFAERKRSLLRKLGSTATGLISKLFGGGKP